MKRYRKIRLRFGYDSPDLGLRKNIRRKEYVQHKLFCWGTYEKRTEKNL